MASQMIKGAFYKVGKKALDWVAIKQCTGVGDRLRKYGLRYEDLYDQTDSLDVQEALSRLPTEVVDARNQRIKRAMDLSMKHDYLPKELQAVQTPFRSYLQEMLDLVIAERKEREALGATPLYERSLP